MELEVVGDLGAGPPGRALPEVEVDLPPGRVTEGVGQRRDGGAELVGAEVGLGRLPGGSGVSPGMAAPHVDGLWRPDRRSTHVGILLAP